MSNIERRPQETRSGSLSAVALGPTRELLAPREVVLGGTRGAPVRRTLPNRTQRMVGAWCFLDEFGPDDVRGGTAMRIPPHPHTGLQTVTWLLDGAIRHLDSIGSDQLIRPGQLNLMTAGRGIAHAEDPSAELAPTVHGVQLWTALPDAARDGAPGFEHHADLPVVELDGVTATVLMGELAGSTSPATTYTPLVGADTVLGVGADARVPVEPAFEYAVLALLGDVEVDGVPVALGNLCYLGDGRSDVTLRSTTGGRALLLGGEPFEEDILMWWNFVGRSHDEIVAMRRDWELSAAAGARAQDGGPGGTDGGRFGIVHGFDGDPLPAPTLPTARLRARRRRSEPSARQPG